MISIAFRKLMIEHPKIVRDAVLTQYQIDIIKTVKRIEERDGHATSVEVANSHCLSVSAAGTLLHRLVDKGYLKRLNIGAPSGGNMFAYKMENGL